MAGDLKIYAVAATRYIIDLEESIDLCSGKVDAMNTWSMEMGKSAQ